MAVAAFVSGYGGALLSHTLPYARMSLDLTEGEFNWVFAATRAASFLALLFAMVGDRRGRRRPFLLAVALLPTSNLLTSLVPGAIPFVVFQSITRISVVAIAALAVVILAEELSPPIRGYGIGIYAMTSAMGTGLSLILLPITERSDDAWRILFALTAVGFLALPLLAKFLNESRAFVPDLDPVSFGQAMRAGVGKYFWPLAGVAFFVAAFSSPAFNFVLERMIDDLQWEAGPARFLLIVFSGAGTLGLLAGGRAADLIGRRPTTVAAILLGLVGGLGFYSLGSGWLLAPSIFIASFGASMLTPAFGAHKTELFPTRIRATIGGWISNAAIAGSIGGFVFGALYVDSLGLSMSIAVLGVGLVFATFLALRLPETRGRDLLGAAREAATPPEHSPE